MFGVVTDILLAVAAVVGTIVAVLQYRARKLEQGRADRAEDARNRMASELEGTREELSRSSKAQERLVEAESDTLQYSKRSDRSVASSQRNRERAEDRSRKRAESRQKSQDRKMLQEQKKQTKASEQTAKEAKKSAKRRK